MSKELEVMKVTHSLMPMVNKLSSIRVREVSTCQPVQTLGPFREVKDIQVLNLECLTKIEGMVLVESFFKEIKEGAKNYLPEEHVNICLSYLSQDLRLFIEPKLSGMVSMNLEQIKDLLVTDHQEGI